VAGGELSGGAESAGAGGHGDGGLHPGADQRSSDEAGRADGAGRETEDRERRHGGSVGWTGVNWREVMRGEWMETGKGEDEVVVYRLDFAGGVVSLPQAMLSHRADMARRHLISNTCF